METTKNDSKNRHTRPEDPIFHIVSSGIPKGDRKKAEILDAVVQLVADGGFESLTFDKIGKTVNAQKSHVKYHFETKEEMVLKSFQYVLSFGQQCLAGELEGSQPGLDRLSAYVRGHFLWLKQKPEHLRFFLICYGRCVYDEKIRDINNFARQQGYKRILGILQEVENLSAESQQFWAQLIHDQITGALIDIVGTKEVPSPYLQRQKLQETSLVIEKIWSQLQ